MSAPRAKTTAFYNDRPTLIYRFRISKDKPLDTGNYLVLAYDAGLPDVFFKLKIPI
jgi:hypothetical protein